MSKTGIRLELIGQDGNAFMILGLASKALKRAGAYEEFWDQYHNEATSGDYDQLLRTTMEYFNVDGFDDDVDYDDYGNDYIDDAECYYCGRDIMGGQEVCDDCDEEMNEE